ncbi:MAG TPA: FAD binding domain-containing protein [Anaerolineales bacterium]|nr:FAD binding domain-containing protein [Anaerolineales bacterium]
MITEYHRPVTLDETVSLIARPALTLPMGGGIVLNAPHDLLFAVADLQSLGLDEIEIQGKFLRIGATASLRALAESQDTSPELRRVIELEATANLRNQASVAGTLVSADGRSPFGCAMMALGVQLHLLPGGDTVDYGQVLQTRAGAADGLLYLPGRLILQATLHSGTSLAYEYAARSPADRPVVAVAAARWPSGRLRIVVGGWGRVPRLALDANDPGGVAEAVDSAAAAAGDEWATAEYRRDAAVKLARRAIDRLGM